MKRSFGLGLVFCAQFLPLPSSAQEENLTEEGKPYFEVKAEPLSDEVAYNTDFSQPSKDSSVLYNENELVSEEKKKEETFPFYAMVGGGYAILAGKYSASALSIGLRYEGRSQGLDLSYLTIRHSWAARKETISAVPFFKLLFYDRFRVFTGIGPAVSKTQFNFFFHAPNERYYSFDASASFQFTYLLKYKYLQGFGFAINAIQPVYFLNQERFGLYKTYYPSTTYSLLIDF